VKLWNYRDLSQGNSKHSCYKNFLFLRTSLTTEGFLSHSGFLDHIQLTHTIGFLLWTSDQSRRGLYLHRTTQHRNTRDKHQCPQRDSNPRPQQPSGRKPTTNTNENNTSYFSIKQLHAKLC
jgi:hypothetical protein